jgi:hypothetical protein
MAKGRKSKTPKRSFGALKKSNEKKAVERQSKADEKLISAAAKKYNIQDTGPDSDIRKELERMRNKNYQRAGSEELKVANSMNLGKTNVGTNQFFTAQQPTFAEVRGDIKRRLSQDAKNYGGGILGAVKDLVTSGGIGGYLLDKLGGAKNTVTDAVKDLYGNTTNAVKDLYGNTTDAVNQIIGTGDQSSVANEVGIDSVLAQIARENQNNSSPFSFQDALQNATADLNTSAVPNLDPRVNYRTPLGTFGVSPQGFDYNNQGAVFNDKFNLGANVNPLDQSYNVGFNSYLPNDFGLSGGYSSGQDGGIMASKFLPSDFPGTNGFALSGGANITNDGRFDPTIGIATQIDPLQMLGLGGGLELPVTVDARGTYRNGRFDPSINLSLPFGNEYNGLGYLFK